MSTLQSDSAVLSSVFTWLSHDVSVLSSCSSRSVKMWTIAFSEGLVDSCVSEAKIFSSIALSGVSNSLEVI